MIISSAALAMTACEGMVKDLDISPNSPRTAPPQLVLTTAQLGNVMFHEGEVARLAGMWCGYFTGSDRQYVSLYEYNTTSGDFDNAWSPIYPNVVMQARIIQREAAKANNLLMVGIAQVLEAHVVGMAASLWGDVPYREAVDGAKFPTPKFDPQTQVYADMQDLLTKAIDNLNKGVVNAITNPGASDIYYGGNKAKWIQAAYTLKARYFMHTKEYQKAYDAAKLGISTAANNMMAKHGQTFGKDFNIYYDFMVYNRSGYLTADEAYVTKLFPTRNNAKTDESGRFGYLFITDNGYYEPNPYCLFDGWGATGFFGGDTSFPLITFEENTLTLAEAAVRTGRTAEALAELNKYRAYLNAGGYFNDEWGTSKYLPYDLADFAAGGMENKDNIAQDRALLREILEERYVTFVGQIEGFNDVRRTLKETDVRVKVTPNKGTQIPQRFLYPQVEINTNPSVPKTGVGLFDATAVNR